MIGPEQLAAGERAENGGDFVAAAAAYRAVTGVGDESLAAEAHFRLGRVTWRQGRFTAALTAFENARAVAERIGATELLARVDNGIGAVHYALGDYVAARRSYAAALAGSNNPGMHGKIILNLGVIENIQGNLPAAREHYERAYGLFQQHGDAESAMLALHNRGMVEADLELWEEANLSYLAALDLATGLGNQDIFAKSLVSRSRVLMECGSTDEAIAQCDRALEIFQNVSDEVGRGEALRWRARARERAGQLTAAEADANEAMRIAIRSGARLLEAEAARDVGVIRLQLGDRVGATKELKRAVALFTKLGAKRDADEARTHLPRRTPARGVARLSSEQPPE